MMICDAVGQRVLLQTARYASVGEYRVLEVSPSRSYVKLQDIHGTKYWKPASEVFVVEVLPTLSTPKEFR